MAAVGEWIKGPFKHATISAFVVEVKERNVKLVVKDIETHIDHEVPSLRYGSIHSLPEEVITRFYTTLSLQEQTDIINLAQTLNDEDWYNESIDKFTNPFNKVQLPNHVKYVEKKNIDMIYSQILSRVIELAQDSKQKLYDFYQEAIKKGLTNRMESPDDINNTEMLDVAISSIVLVGKNPAGIEFVRSLNR